MDETNPEPSKAEIESVEHKETQPAVAAPLEDKKVPSSGKFAKLWHKYLAKKKLTFPLTALFLILVILAVPVSRYKVLGLFIKRQFSVEVHDAQTNEPVSNADVSLDGQNTKTDSNGKATVTVKPGNSQLSVKKNYYSDFSQKVLVPLSKTNAAYQVKLQATGRQVPISVSNKITGKPIADATIKASGTEAKTGQDGQVTIVLPIDQATLKATISASGYNDAQATIKITDQKDKANDFNIVPAGKIYFLSKASGNIDVVKTNLDGSDRKTVLAGTGKEDDTGTVLLASRDWKYLVLQSRRDSKLAKLYLIDTSTDKLTTIDEGNATFNITGWIDHYFIYTVDRIGKQPWESNQTALKSFNADSKVLTTLDQTIAEGHNDFDYASQAFGSVFALPNSIVYTINWNSDCSSGRINNKQAEIVSIQPAGGNKTVMLKKGAPADACTINFDAVSYEPEGIYFQYNFGSTFYKYEDGKVVQTSDVNTDTFFSKVYNTYLVSPSAKQTFWYEERDGKNTLFVGDSQGKLGKVIGNLTEYVTYGWYTDNYLLVSKKGSELYILANAPIKDIQPLKITDYHKPNFNFNGYGGGYGGI